MLVVPLVLFLANRHSNTDAAPVFVYLHPVTMTTIVKGDETPFPNMAAIKTFKGEIIKEQIVYNIVRH